MKRKHNGQKRFRRQLYTVLGILCVVALFGIAIVFPGYYNKLYDQKTLNHVSFADVNISTYEASYNSFASKLYALARASTEEGGPLRAVRTNELNQEMNRGGLTKIVNEELQKLYENKVLDSKMKPKEKRMTLCERYTIYDMKETDGMKGISCWKLVYENSKRTITIYLDEEYHKIYSMEILYHEIYDKVSKSAYASSNHQMQDIYDAEKKEKSQVDKDADGSSNSSSIQQGEFTVSLNGLALYYDIHSYKEASCVLMLEDSNTGVIEFDKQYSITLYKTYTIDQKGNSKCIIGVPLEKMIQL